MPTDLSPLLLTPHLLTKVWGGRRMAALDKPIPAGAAIGESWELADLGATSASGAGGAAVRSVVAAGPASLVGRTLQQAMDALGHELMGDLARSQHGEFPLLLKYLDASENLSVQVHPSPAYARAHPGAHLKTESWYILDAEPGAVLYIGLRPGVTREAFAQAARLQAPGLVEMLQRVPAAAGDCHTLPSGTIHALGAGVLVAEVQTPSDTTFRLYDWGRVGRELHIEAALEAAWDPAIAAPQCAALAEGALCGRLASTPFYTIDEARPLPGDELTIGYACRQARTAPFVLMVLAGRGTLTHSAGHFPARAIARGQTLLIPAGAARHTILHAGDGLRVLRVGLCG